MEMSQEAQGQEESPLIMKDALPPTLEPTWSIFDEEPGMDDIFEQAGESLDRMVERLRIAIFRTWFEPQPRLFLARYEFPKYEEDFQHPDAIFAEEALGFIDFLAGFPMECVEMLGMVGEHSTDEEEIETEWFVEAADGPTAPVPEEFFEGMPKEKLLLNTLFFANEGRSEIFMVENLAGEPEPENLHSWARANIKVGDRFPIPGEFFGLAVRMMPDKPWGPQLSSPFLYSGNWMDTVFYTGAVVKEVIPPNDNFAFPRYLVQWRKYEAEVYPSDFAEYRVGDRVTILKDVDVDKGSQQWKDDDVKEVPPGSKWVIAPITFYDDLGGED
jgi:hypothetical protein